MAIPVPSTRFVYKTITGTNPAANTECSDTVPAGVNWMLISVIVACVQGITQTPQPSLVLNDGTNNFLASVGSTTAQSASTTVTYTWGVGMPLTGLVGSTPTIITTGSLPANLFLKPGYIIKTVTAGIGANTDFGAPIYNV